MAVGPGFVPDRGKADTRSGTNPGPTAPTAQTRDPAPTLNRPLQRQDSAIAIMPNRAWRKHWPRLNQVFWATLPAPVMLTRIGSRSSRPLCRIACLPFRDPAKRSAWPAARTEIPPHRLGQPRR